MITPERIEAAARAFDEQFDAHLSRDTAERMLEAAFPELVPEIFDGLPHAWIAPWEATQTMADAGRALDDALGGPAYPRDYYRAMRDAHLSREQSE